MNILDKAIDIDIMEFKHEMALMEDAMVISEYNGYYYESSNSENIFQKSIQKVKELIEKVIDKIKQKFSKDAIDKQEKEFEIQCEQDPSKKNKKVKVIIDDKVYALSKKAMDGLMNCKTKEEAEKYMEEYKKKRTKIIAASTATIAMGSYFVYLRSKLSKATKNLNNLQKDYEDLVIKLSKTEYNLNSSKENNERIQKILDETNSKLKAARDREDRLNKSVSGIGKNINKIAEKISNTAFDSKEVIYGSKVDEFDKEAKQLYPKAHGDELEIRSLQAQNRYIISQLTSIFDDAVNITRQTTVFLDNDEK